MALTNLTKGTVVDSEGGSATTNLAQGVSKSWINFTTVTSTVAQDSFNVGSMLDFGTGYSGVVFTNNMSNNDYSKTMSAGGGSYRHFADTVSHGTAFTNGYRVYVTDATTARDCDDNQCTVHGDLA